MNDTKPNLSDFKDFAHTGPGTLAGRYMRLFWQPVYLAEKLKPGRAVPIRVLSEDFTLYRGHSGEPHIVASSCPHRGTQLSTGWVEDDCIRCFYHGWKFDSSGQCVEQPAEQEHFAKSVKILSYPTKEYLGLIFAYLGEGEAPPFPRYPELEMEGVLVASEYTRMCNYFNNLENGLDPVHTAFVHRKSSLAEGGLQEIPKVKGEESDWGITMFGERANGVRINQCGMPNILLIKINTRDPKVGWMDHLAYRVPIDDEHHKSFNINLLPSKTEEAYRQKEAILAESKNKEKAYDYTKKILAGELHVDELDEDEVNVIDVQDQVAQIGQGVIAPRENDILGRSDALIILLRKIWERELRSLAKGNSPKKWNRPDHLKATSGVEKVKSE